MKDKLLREIELRLSLQLPVEQREKAMQCVISALNDYDVTERVTDVTVRHSRYFWDISNEAMIPKGWYEISDYGDASYVIDDPIVGWQDLPDPWE